MKVQGEATVWIRPELDFTVNKFVKYFNKYLFD